MSKLVALDFLPTQWTNDMLAALLSRFSGVLRSHVMANKDNDSLGFGHRGDGALSSTRRHYSSIGRLDCWKPCYLRLMSRPHHSVRAIEK